MNRILLADTAVSGGVHPYDFPSNRRENQMPRKPRRTSHPYDSTLTSETMTSTPPTLIPPGTDRQGAHRATGARACHTDTQIANRIIKFLEHCYAVGRHQDEVYSDWLQFVAALLDQEEPNMIALATTGAYAPDPPEVTVFLERLRKTYPYREGAKVQYLEYFLKAYAELRVSPQYGVMDVVGSAFMLFGHPSKWAGQFFTPASVALLMAQLSVPDGEALVNERLKAAIEKSPMETAAMLAGVALEGEVAQAWFVARVIPLAIEHYQPVTVCDPAVGSGIMLVSASSCFPAFANALGLVQYVGQDIDADVVLMSKINLKLYGLNGHAMRRTILQAEQVLRQHGIGVEDRADASTNPLDHKVLPLPALNEETLAAA